VKEALQVLSLGAGVQSTTLLLMSCKGVLPKLDAAIFADTQWEHPDLYVHLKWLTDEAERHNIPLHVVTAGSLRKHTLHGFVRGKRLDKPYASLPLYVVSPSGSQGMIRRQCTREYKADPVEKYTRRSLLGLAKGERAPIGAVDHWFGISSDEPRRMRQSDKRWKRHVYPLCGIPERMLDRPYTRQMCVEWLHLNYPGHNVPRSSCIGCPYHTNAEWRYVRKNETAWADVLEIDEAIRHADEMNGTVYLHRSCTPLVEVDLRNDEEKGQHTFGWDDECLGYCGT